VLGGARLTNEAAYAWTRLAKGIIGTDHVDAQLGDGLPAHAVLGLPRATIDQTCAAGGTILYLGPDPKEELPVLFLRLRHAVVEGGARLIEVAPVAGSLTSYATVSVRSVPGDAAATVAKLLADGTLGDGPVRVVLGRASVAESADGVLAAAAALLAAKPDTTFLPALRRGNVLGAIDMGMAPGLLPGRITRAAGSAGVSNAPTEDGLDATGILEAAAAGHIDTLVLVGADPLADFPDRTLAERALAGARTVIAVDTFLSESSRRADVVLAAAGFGEVSGTTTNIEGRVTTVEQKVTPPGTARPDWLIASELAARLGTEFAYTSAEQIWAEIETTAPSHAGITMDRLRATPDGIVVTGGSIEFVPPTDVAVPAVDSYSLRLVASRVLYDHGSRLEHSPSSRGLATSGPIRVNATDLARLGLPEGGLVRVSANDRSFVVEAVADADVPTGVAAIALDQSAGGPTAVIDATAPVTEVHLEASS
jgi:NADH-quinone oxidoreductase subunit G